MSDEIPPNDPDLPDKLNDSDVRLEAAEASALEAESKLAKLNISEARQRIWIRYAALSLGIVVILAMFGMMYHLSHELFWGSLIHGGRSYSAVIIAAPTLCITTVTVAVLVGAFRRFRDEDAETVANGAASAARYSRSL